MKLDVIAWLGFVMFATSGVIVPICLPEISETLSTDLSEGGGIETARTFMILILVVFVGVLARKWGKKPFVASGQYLLGLGLLMASLANNYPIFVLSLMIGGIGGGFTEALMNPLIVDIHPKNSGKYLNISNAFYPIGVMSAALVFGELLTLGISWRTIFGIGAICCGLVGTGFAISRFPFSHRSDHSSGELIGEILLMPGFWIFAAAIFLGAGVESAFTFWSRTYVSEYLEELPRAGAIAVVIFAGAMAVGRLFVGKISTEWGLKRIMLASAVLGMIISMVVPFATSLMGFYLFLALAGFAAACFWPSVLAEAGECLKVDSTILFAMLSCMGIAGFGLTPWIMGIIGDRLSLKAAFWVVPLIFALLVLILLVEWHVSDRIRKPAKP